MKRIVSILQFLILLVLLATELSVAQATVPNDPNLTMFTLESGSKIWFDGESTVNTFNCISTHIDAVAYLSSGIEHVSQAQYQHGQKRVLVAVPVVSFDCGKEGMNHDMYHALKEKQFHSIKYEMISADPVAATDNKNEWYEVKTRGNLTIAGKTNVVEMVICVKEERHGTYRIEGSKVLSMMDFGIDPPSVLFGLIHVKDTLVIHFDLTASVHPPTVTKATYSVETENGK